MFSKLRHGFYRSSNLLVLSMLLVGITLWLFPRAQRSPAKAIALPVDTQFRFGKFSIDLERATTPEQLFTGLMFRDVLPVKRGMLLVPDSQSSFVWAKNVRFPIDIIFIHAGDGSNTVISTATLASCSTPDCPKVPVPANTDYAIEINAGLVNRMNLRAGSTVTIRRKF
jgi:uncharacterized membrane protein (UPF0127 family)